MSRWTKLTPPDTICAKEIMELLHLSACAMSTLRHEPHSTMPLPVNDDKKYFLYDRQPMLEWIAEYSRLRERGNAHPGLDNKLAQDFIRKP